MEHSFKEVCNEWIRIRKLKREEMTNEEHIFYMDFSYTNPEKTLLLYNNMKEKYDYSLCKVNLKTVKNDFECNLECKKNIA